jgi:putative transposase
MARAGIQGALRSKRVRTTRQDRGVGRHPDLVERQFVAKATNRLWVTDLTFVPTWAGVAYVCFITDVFSRMIVGWRVASHIRTPMVLDAIEMARWNRGLKHPGLRCHSDAGSQGGFNWSSQHLTSEVVSDGNIGAATGDMGGAREVGLTGPAAGRAA